MDKLKLVGTAVALVAVFGLLVWWQRRRPEDDEILARVEQLAEDMCACSGTSCAELVLERFNREVAGKEVAARDDGLSSAWSRAQIHVAYLEQCHGYLQEGRAFQVERTGEGKIRNIRLVSDQPLVPGL